jgi:hypothetical protein
MGKLGILFMTLMAAGSAAVTAQPTNENGILINEDTLVPANPQLTNDAIVYYNNLNTPLQDFKKANYNYTQAITRIRKARAVEKKRQELIKVLQSNKEFLRKYESFKGDSTLKLELIRYLDLVEIVLQEDFGKILDMEDINAQAYDQDEAHQLAIDKAIEKLHASYDVMKNADDNFFKKYAITVNREKDEMTLKIEKANKAIEYYNTIYRIFFKANKEDYYARQAISSKDIVGLEQHAMTLVSFSEDGLAQLKQKNGYEGDNDLLSTAIKLLDFYLNEGQVTCPANVDFNMKADNVQSAAKKFNSIKEADRKQEDVDQYNKAVEVYNKAVKEINKINNGSFKTHKQLIEQWNKQVEKYFDKHS